MPTTRRKRVRARKANLSPYDLFYLLAGWSLKNNQHIPLENASQLWEQHRAELLKYWLQDPNCWEETFKGSPFQSPRPGGPGTRPWAWWEYEAPEQLGEEEKELGFLIRHDLLTKEEKSIFKRG